MLLEERLWLKKFKTSVGGQALMEGIMMKGPKKVCAAVRRPDGQIETKEEPCLPSKWSKIPLVRGVIGMVESLILGYRWLMYSAEISMGEDAAQEEESKLDRWLNEHLGEKAQNFVMSFAAVLGGLMALILFMILPTTIVGLLSKVVPLDGGTNPVGRNFKNGYVCGILGSGTEYEGNKTDVPLSWCRA